MSSDDRYRRSDWAKTPEQISSYVEGFVKRLQSHDPNVIMQADLVELIAYFVRRDSKVTLDKIANYCIDGNMNCERFLHRAINEHVDNVYQITCLNQEIGRLTFEIEKLQRKHQPLWKRIWRFFADGNGRRSHE